MIFSSLWSITSGIILQQANPTKDMVYYKPCAFNELAQSFIKVGSDLCNPDVKLKSVRSDLILILFRNRPLHAWRHKDSENLFKEVTDIEYTCRFQFSCTLVFLFILSQFPSTSPEKVTWHVDSIVTRYLFFKPTSCLDGDIDFGHLSLTRVDFLKYWYFSSLFFQEFHHCLQPADADRWICAVELGETVHPCQLLLSTAGNSLLRASMAGEHQQHSSKWIFLIIVAPFVFRHSIRLWNITVCYWIFEILTFMTFCLLKETKTSIESVEIFFLVTIVFLHEDSLHH